MSSLGRFCLEVYTESKDFLYFVASFESTFPIFLRQGFEDEYSVKIPRCIICFRFTDFDDLHRTASDTESLLTEF